MLSCREAGVSECYVVIGSQEKNILPLVEHLGQRNGISVRAVQNPNWEKGNGTSLLAVAPFLSGSFFVIMCDHLFDPDILRCLRKAAQKTGACLLAVGRKIDRIFNWSDTSKVRIEGYAITDIGKKSPGSMLRTRVSSCATRLCLKPSERPAEPETAP